MLPLVVAVVAGPFLALVIHELGHACAAVALGGRDVRLHRRPWGAAVEATFGEDAGDAPDAPDAPHAPPLSPHTVDAAHRHRPGSTTASRPIAFLLAGPAASLTVGAALVVVGGPVAIVGAISVLLGGLTLGGSDGKRALAIVRNRAGASTL